MPPELVILSENTLLVIIAVSSAAGVLIGSILTARLFTRALAADHRELNVDVAARGVRVRADPLVRLSG